MGSLQFSPFTPPYLVEYVAQIHYICKLINVPHGHKLL